MTTQYAGYNLTCIIDSRPVEVPCYIGDEYGLPRTIPKYVALTAPSAEMMARGSVTLAYTVSSVMTGQIKTLDGSAVDYLPAPGTMINGMVWTGETIPENEIPSNMVIAVIQIGLAPLIIGLICLAIIMAAGAVIMVAKYVSETWKAKYATQQQKDYQGYLLEAMKVVSDTKTDLNGDGVMDIREVIWANGKVEQFALTDEGVAALGGTSKIVDPGTTADEPPVCEWGFLCDISDIGLILMGIGVLVVAVVVLPKLVGSGGGGATYIPTYSPPMERYGIPTVR